MTHGEGAGNPVRAGQRELEHDQLGFLIANLGAGTLGVWIVLLVVALAAGRDTPLFTTLWYLAVLVVTGISWREAHVLKTRLDARADPMSRLGRALSQAVISSSLVGIGFARFAYGAGLFESTVVVGAALLLDAGVVATMSSIFGAVLACVLPSSLMIVAALVLGGTPETRMLAALVLLFVATMLLFSWRLNRTLLSRARLTQSLREARDEARDAAAARARFLSSASHDLGQPVHGARLVIEHALPRMDEAVREALEPARRALENAAGMFESILDLSRLEGDGSAPVRRVVAVAEILDPIVAELGALPDAQGRLRYARCTATVETDPALLGRAVRNLLSNALAYARAGRVLVGCRRRQDVVDVFVIDQGPGMTEQELARAFGEFSRGEHPGRVASVGLGLAIVDRIARRLDHAFHADSGPVTGTGMRLSVPRRSPEASAPGAPGAVVRIDAEDAQREALAAMIADWGYEAVEAVPTAGVDAPLLRVVNGADAVLAEDRRRSPHALVILVEAPSEAERAALAAADVLWLPWPVAPARLRSFLRRPRA
jgi:signal transduction histidine kinase